MILTCTRIGNTSATSSQLRMMLNVIIGDTITYSEPCKKKKNFAKEEKNTTKVGFEPTRAEHNGLAVHRLNHSATSSCHNTNPSRYKVTLQLQHNSYLELLVSVIARLLKVRQKPRNQFTTCRQKVF